MVDEEYGKGFGIWDRGKGPYGLDIHCVVEACQIVVLLFRLKE